MVEHPLLGVLTKAGMKMGLARMRSYLETLGSPHLAYPVIHVAGTNGKGSVCRMLGAILEEAGYKTGITTSPHLQEVNERIRIGSTPISDAELDSLLFKLDRARSQWASQSLAPPSHPNDDTYPLTYFEFSTAAAFQHFADQKVDIAIVEVGMGGRLDATNVVSPLLTSICTIGLDHTDQLGPDHASIAAEKAGILKNGVPAVIGPLPAPAIKVIRAVAAERSVPLHSFGEHFEVDGTTNHFRYRSRQIEREGLALKLQGNHQLINAALALHLIELLPEVSQNRLVCREEAIRKGLLKAENRGRMEWISPNLLLDGAHNPDGATALANYLARIPHDQPRTLVLGGGTDKDIRSVAITLAPQFDRIVTTAGSHPKARSALDIARELQGLPVLVEPAPTLGHALHQPGMVVVAGSLYLVGEVRARIIGGVG